MELARVVKLNFSLASEVEVLNYVYTGDEPIEVMARVMLGSATRPIAGGGLYKSRIYLNDVVLSPESDVVVQPGRTETILVSRAIPLERDDVVSIRAVGLSTDLAVDAITSLRDVTPAKITDFTGGGSVLVDHNYGGTDALTVMTLSNVRIDNATILAYRRDDYLAGQRTSEFVVGQTTTNVDGRWVSPIMLDVGEYTLLVYRQGVITAKSFNLSVT
jgi:hypothetical protein